MNFVYVYIDFQPNKKNESNAFKVHAISIITLIFIKYVLSLEFYKILFLFNLSDFI